MDSKVGGKIDWSAGLRKLLPLMQRMALQKYPSSWDAAGRQETEAALAPRSAQAQVQQQSQALILPFCSALMSLHQEFRVHFWASGAGHILME